MRFIDEAHVRVYGGNGGSGSVSWRREKYLPKGGPDGGDGGNGGSVIFVAEPNLNTLIDFSFNPEIRAQHGASGEANCRYGKTGSDVVRPVPVGTQVYFADRLVADLSTPKARWIAARGGRGGKGNHFFKSATNQAPDYAQNGCAGEVREFRLILKSVADVGLLGLPNVGKSTLVSVISKAHPKIADYPFTTLRPSLGVVLLDDTRRFVIADIPGLIPGAHQGKGLGIKFLQHIERTSVLAQLIDVSPLTEDETLSEEPSHRAISQFEALDNELLAFSSSLAARPRLIVFSKSDFSQNETAYEETKGYFAEKGYDTLLISSQTGRGLEQLKEKMYELIMGAKP